MRLKKAALKVVGGFQSSLVPEMGVCQARIRSGALLSLLHQFRPAFIRNEQVG